MQETYQEKVAAAVALLAEKEGWDVWWEGDVEKILLCRHRAAYGEWASVERLVARLSVFDWEFLLNCANEKAQELHKIFWEEFPFNWQRRKIFCGYLIEKWTGEKISERELPVCS